MKEDKELVEKMLDIIVDKVEYDVTMGIYGMSDAARECAAVASEHYKDKWVGIDERLPHADSPGDRLSTDLYILCKDGQVIEGWMDYAFRRFENLQGVMVEPTHFIEKKRPIPQPPQE